YETWGGQQLRGMQHLFVSTAERCVDLEIAAFLRDLDVLSILRQDEARISESRQALIRHDGVDLFVKLNLVEKDGKLGVREGREKSIESLLSRTEELKPKN